MPPVLLSIEETAQALGIGRSLLYQMLVRGEIESLKIGRRRVVPMAAVEAFVQRLREEQASELTPVSQPTSIAAVELRTKAAQSH